MCLPVSIFFSVLCVNAKSLCLSCINVCVSTVSEHCAAGEEEAAKALWLTDSWSQVVGGFIVVCQPSEESDDGSLLSTLCSLQLPYSVHVVLGIA